MNKDFKYMPLIKDATSSAGGDVPFISKHMSKSALQMNEKSPLELSKKKEKSAKYVAKQKEFQEKNKNKKEKITYQSKVNSIARAEKVSDKNRAQRLREKYNISSSESSQYGVASGTAAAASKKNKKVI
jgi:predicted RND superfamily exporter protein